MKIKRITALLLSALCLTAVPQIPAVKDLGTNYTITAEAAAGVVGYVTMGKIRYNIQRDSSNNLYAIAAKADSDITYASIPAYVTYDKKSVPVKRVGGNAFTGVTNLTRLDMTYATNLTEISENAFNGAKIGTLYIGSNRISNGTLTVNSKAFYCADIGTLRFYGNKVVIKSNAFTAAVLTTVQFDTSVKTATFEASAFAYTKKLITLTFDSQSTALTIYKYCFQSSPIQRCNLPATLKTIPEGCFNSCTSLSTFNIPSSVTFIGDYAFAGAFLPSSFKIGKNVTKISDTAFRNIFNTAYISVDSENTKFKSDSGVLCSKDGTKLYCYPPKRTVSTYTSPAKYIVDGAFSYNPYLQELKLTNYYDKIESKLSSLQNLEKITIPTSAYNKYSNKEFLDYYGHLFLSTKVHCINGNEMIVTPAGKEPYFNSKIRKGIEADLVTYNRSQLANRFSDKYADYVVANFTNSSMSDLEKAVKIQKWILDRATYTPDDKASSLDHDAFGIFAHKDSSSGKYLSVCEGYARCYDLIMNKAGVETIYVGGDGHAWNIVKIDGKYYFADVCWDDCQYDAGKGDYYLYFMRSYHVFEIDGHGKYMNSIKSLRSEYDLNNDLHLKYLSFTKTAKDLEK